MGDKKQIAFYYDAELRSEDTVIDPDGSTTVSEKGAIIRMPGQNWRVTHVAKAAGKDDVVAYKIYLARA